MPTTRVVVPDPLKQPAPATQSHRDIAGDGARLQLAPPPRPVPARMRAANASRVLHGWLVFAVAANLIAFDPSGGVPPLPRVAAALAVGAIFLGAFRRERRSGSFARLSGLAQGVYRVKAVLVGSLVAGCLAWFVPWLALSPQRLLLSAAVLAFVSSAWSYMTRKVLGARMVRRAVIIGDGEPVRDFVTAFQADPHPEYELVGVVTPVESRAAALAGDVPELGTLEELEAVLEAHAVDTVAVSVKRGRLDLFSRLAAYRGDITVQELPQFSEHVFGRVPVEVINAAWFMHMIHPFYRPYSRIAKRAADMVAAGFIALLALPLLPLVALLVRLTSPGPVLFSQVRVGEHGEEFRIYKFRTMVVDAERNGAQYAQRNDPRITTPGRFMRATRLDELPQLWNILVGHMSFVGPRPERPEFVTDLEQSVPYYQRRHMVKPGLTGWAQVRLGYSDSVEGAADKLGFELYYLKHQSLFLDFVIFVETIRVVLLRFGSR